MPYIITPKYGNITDAKVDFTVNASNTRLILGSGVSMAFKRHCGIELQKEMDTIINKYGELSHGDVVATSTCKEQNFRYILHAAVMNYTKKVTSKNPTSKTIIDILNNIDAYLEWFIKQHQISKVSLALPLLGCGVGRLKKEVVLQLYKEHFSKNFTYTCNVEIYGYSKEDFELIKQFF